MSHNGLGIVHEIGIDPPQSLPVDQWDSYWLPWIKRLSDAFPKVQTHEQELAPASVAANTTAEQTFTVTGLNINDFVVVNKPSLDAGIGIGGARVSAANTIAITYINSTAGAIVPTTEDYKILAIRL